MENTSNPFTLALIKFDRTLAVPYYRQLKDGLTGAIRDQTLSGGVRLPSEREFCEYFGISRLTVRRALNDLTNSGFLYSQPGKGTFVSHPKVEQGTHQLMGLSADMRKRGHAITSQVLNLAIMPARPRIAQQMNLTPGDEVVLLERLRSLDDEPLAIERCYLNHRYCQGISEYDLSKSLYALLRDTYMLKIARAGQTYEAVPAGEREARVLNLPRHAP
jgi:GntR family transcriptional regulator